MLYFIAGVVVGSVAGVFLMALCAVSGRSKVND